MHFPATPLLAVQLAVGAALVELVFNVVAVLELTFVDDVPPLVDDDDDF